jgi:hypothetical protein
MAAGIATSLVVHALLLLALRHSALPTRPAETTRTVESIAVWLRPPAPVIPAKPEAAVAETAPARPAQPKRRSHAPANVIAMPKTASDTAGQPDVFTVEPAPAPEAPHFDPDAARKLARRIASEPDPARAGTAVGQLEPKPYATETKAARAIASAKRRDCKDGLPGGLLGPILVLMDKKDSGCKW